MTILNAAMQKWRVSQGQRGSAVKGSTWALAAMASSVPRRRLAG